MAEALSSEYWEGRYTEQNTPWDIGAVSPPLRHYFDKLKDRDIRILIPGAGYAHEALYLHQQGFKRVSVCDWAAAALERISTLAPSYPSHHLLHKDFFTLKGSYDLIIEQTFFCAIQPAKRKEYVAHSADLLVEGGKLAGLLFEDEFPFEGPPFGGEREEYRKLFSSHFEIKELSISNLSVKPRAGRELFFEFVKK
jgi:hypothetical protein